MLFAGYGAQGGTVKQLRELLDSTGREVFVNSSRGLLYPYDPTDQGWRDKVVKAVTRMKDELNFERSRSKFLLVLGVSGVGKSEIMRELRKLDSRFVYISPFMTRGLRLNETDKIPISDAELDEKQQRGELLVINDLYGIRYATPRELLMQTFREEKFPLLDWPINRLDIMEQAFPGKIYRVYIEPPDLDTLQIHLADGRDPDQKRFDSAVIELIALKLGRYDSHIDCRAMSRENEITAVAKEIYAQYLQSMGL